MDVPARLEPFVAAGLYDPDATNEAERRELLEYLLERFPAADLVDWASRAPLIGLSSRAINPQPNCISAVEVAARAGVPLDDVLALRQALGVPVADPEAAELPETAVDDMAVFALGSALFGAEGALAFARVLGWAATRTMEAARALFASVITDDGARPTELDFAKANELAAGAWAGVRSVVSRLMAELPRRDQGFVLALLDGDVRLAVAFVDLVGSTEWAEAADTTSHAAALRRFETRAWGVASAHGGRVVKTIGDEAMIVAPEAENVCRTACELCEWVDADPDLPRARGAVAFGPVTVRDGDYFGPVVNLAARATKEASPGAVVVTTEVLRRLDPAAWSAAHLSPRALRGIGAVQLATVTPR